MLHDKKTTIEERSIIQMQLELDVKPADIARMLNRSTSTLSRELRQNGWVRLSTPRGPGRPHLASGYQATAAQAGAAACAATLRGERRLRPRTALWGQVIRYLKRDYSPEQIASTLALVLRNTPSLQISHEIIYTAIYAMPCGELRTQVIGWLRFGRARH